MCVLEFGWNNCIDGKTNENITCQQKYSELHWKGKFKIFSLLHTEKVGVSSHTVKLNNIALVFFNDGLHM